MDVRSRQQLQGTAENRTSTWSGASWRQGTAEPTAKVLRQLADQTTQQSLLEK